MIKFLLNIIDLKKRDNFYMFVIFIFIDNGCLYFKCFVFVFLNFLGGGGVVVLCINLVLLLYIFIK